MRTAYFSESWRAFSFEFIADAPDGADLPVGMILDLLTETFDVYIHGTGITDIFIAPDLIQRCV